MKQSQEIKSQESSNNSTNKGEDALPSNSRLDNKKNKSIIGDKINNKDEDMTGNNVIANLTEENSLLKQEVSGLKHENSLLKQEIAGLKHEISCLMKEISGLKDRNSPFTNEEKEEKENLYAQIRNLKEQNEASKTFIKVFMNRLDQIEEHNKRLMKKEDKLNFFLQAYPQYKPLFDDNDDEKKKDSSDEKCGKKSNKNDGK